MPSATSFSLLAQRCNILFVFILGSPGVTHSISLPSFKKFIHFLEGSWNHEYLRSLAKLTRQIYCLYLHFIINN